ncbi:MAG: hypothetical protein FJ403_23095 [Verrucomicrobia bacterium]|nr:hypothetical protein [Verrucomicrobiota bacterium]
MRESELYVPLDYNDGRPIENEKLTRLKRRLVDEFGGLTHSPQENEGLWRVGTLTFRDRIVILRVPSQDVTRSQQFFLRLKEGLQRDWEQNDVLIIAREVAAV